jgi:hypothetical protein
MVPLFSTSVRYFAYIDLDESIYLDLEVTLFIIHYIIIYEKQGRFIYSDIQGVTKRCRLSWLPNSALVYEPKCGGRGELRVLSQ